MRLCAEWCRLARWPRRRVFVRGPGGARQPAGSFRYRWGQDSDAVLSAALDLARTRAIGVRVGDRTFKAPVD